MIYNDFPILTNSEYEILKNQFNSIGNFSKEQTLNNVINLLQTAKTSLQYSNSFNNYQIKKELNNHFLILNKLEDNFNLIFNINKTNNTIINSFNLFNYIGNLFSIVKLINEWLAKESKEHYKKIIQNSRIEIENLISNILSILSTLNINFYKFM